jgi:hypothetical protein
LIRQREVRNVIDDGQIALPGTFHFCQPSKINEAEQPKTKAHAEPDGSRELFGSFSHAHDLVARVGAKNLFKTRGRAGF